MSSIGQRNNLCVLREVSSGLILNGGEMGDILLPGRYIPPGTVPGNYLDVFLYFDSEDRLIATTETPHAVVGEFAFLEVIQTIPGMGAFLNWGLSKDLLLPIREQARIVRKGEWLVVYIYLDSKSGRIVASSRISRHVGHIQPVYEKGQSVQILVTGQTPLGYKAIVEHTHWGLLYEAELSVPPKIGERREAFVKTVRPDGKIDLGLDPAGYLQRVPSLTQTILDKLQATGRMELDDQSSPEVIRTVFNTSKKAFKQALGALYREQRIRFTHPGVELLKDAPRTRR